MDFLTAFLASFSKPPCLPSGVSPETLAGHIYEEDSESVFHSLLSIFAYGTHYAVPPFTYYFHSLDCYLLLYTSNGCGILQTADNSFMLEEQTLLFFDCRQPFSLAISGTFWNFEAYFCAGEIPAVFCQKQKHILYDFSSARELCRYFQILDTNSKNPLGRNPILDIKYFTNLFSDLILLGENNMQLQKNIPAYLRYMKKCFDYSYAKRYSLIDFEKKLHVNKYRLCHEFSVFYGISPMQYLNLRRIDAAKELLCCADLPISEVAVSVGIENTTHFITLFKRETGITPNVYRHNMIL